MTRLPLLLALTGCASITVRAIDFPAEPTSADATGWAWKQARDVEPEAGVVRFVLVGDMGYRVDKKTDQPGPGPTTVSAAAQRACGGLGGCDFAVMLGDNVYNKGVTTEVDGRFVGNLAALWSWAGPQYWLAGNHDWGPYFWPVGAPTNARVQRQFAWLDHYGSALDTRGAAHFFSFDAGPVGLWAVDSNYLVHACRKDAVFGFRCRGQGVAAVLDATGRSDARWKLALAHHPYRSNGEHGDAGRYRDKGLPLWSGKGYERVLARTVAGRVHLLASGHEHSMQFIKGLPAEHGSLSTAQLVSGAAGKTDGAGKQRNHAAFEAYDTLGFTVIEASDRALVVHIYTVPTDRRVPLADLRYTTCLVGDGEAWLVGEACDEVLRPDPYDGDSDVFGVYGEADAEDLEIDAFGWPEIDVQPL